MSLQLVVDMNLSVEWIAEFATHGWSAVHWSTVGDPRADDSAIMAWALANGHVVFTDFTLLPWIFFLSDSRRIVCGQ